MFNKIFFFLFLILSNIAYSQKNLVLNPSFEEDNGKFRCYFYPNGSFPITNWISGSEGSIDAFTTKLSTKCIMNPLNDSFAGQKPRTGQNFVGFSNVYTEKIDYREYVRGTLSEPLIVGSRYKIEFYVCLSDFSNTASNNIGLVFINNKEKIFANVDPIPLKPDVNYSGKPITEKDKWTLLSFDFIATKPNLDAFLIGNFFSTNETNFQILSESKPVETYLLLDDVSIYRDELAFDLPTHVCKGETIELPKISKTGFKGTWNTEFDSQNSKSYVFTQDSGNPKRQFTFDIEITKGLEFELTTYCQNYEFYIEAKFKENSNVPIVDFDWSLNNIKINNKSLVLKLADFKNLITTENIINVTLTNQAGCKWNEKNVFSGKNLCKIQKEVTPNAHGSNDFLDLSSFGGVDLKIYNRFGNVVYENNNYRTEWNGKLENNVLLPVGNYMYQIQTKIGEEISGWIQLTY